MSFSTMAIDKKLPLHEEVETEFKKIDEAKIENLLLGIPYLVDADNAGGEFSDKCTLILTDVDLAKVLRQMSSKNKYNYGVLPVGKTNYAGLREASQYQIVKDADIEHIIQILGLKRGEVYDNDNVRSLRYGHLMIMTLQDEGGFHLKGLLINLFHCLWPSLLKIPSFLGELMIPLVEATGKGGHFLFFYDMPQYESWKKSLGGEEADDYWSIKYYKGLGFSKKYFISLETHKKYFTWVDERDGDAIDMAFNKNKIEARMTWLQQYEPGTHLDRTEKLIRYSDFVNKELILFFWEDLQQSIPSMVDGLKLIERKSLFSAFKSNLVDDNTSASHLLACVASDFGLKLWVHAHARTVRGMAQDFVGRNNINLFHARGEVGTRHYKGGKYDIDTYIKKAVTKLSPIARYLFPKDDDILLDYPKEDDIAYNRVGKEQPIEPAWYAPVIPLVLVNGSEGVGVGGYSTFVPNYKPSHLCASVRSLLRGEQMVPIHPWYKGFRGTIDKTTAKDSGTSYTTSGIIDQIDETTLEITELPIRTWTEGYRKFLETAKTRIVTCTDKIMDQLMIKEYYEEVHRTTVYFEIIMSKENLQMAREEGLLKVFRLTTTIHTSNMHLLDKNGVIKKYDNPEQILKEFFELRLELYNKRRNMLLDDLPLELSKLRIRRSFVECVLNRNFDFSVLLDRDATIAELKKHGFDDSCVYMLSWNFLQVFTQREKIMELDSQIANLSLRLQELKESTPETLWIKDLDALDLKLEELDKENSESKVMNE